MLATKSLVNWIRIVRGDYNTMLIIRLSCSFNKPLVSIINLHHITVQVDTEHSSLSAVGLRYRKEQSKNLKKVRTCNFRNMITHTVAINEVVVPFDLSAFFEPKSRTGPVVHNLAACQRSIQKTNSFSIMRQAQRKTRNAS